MTPTQISELTGHCGDTMKISLKIDGEIIQDAKIQILGCPGAIASAMAAMDMIKGKSLDYALKMTDRDIFREIEDIPDQKQHCIRTDKKDNRKGCKMIINQEMEAVRKENRQCLSMIFLCTDCGTEVEILMTSSGDIPECSKCGSKKS